MNSAKTFGGLNFKFTGHQVSLLAWGALMLLCLSVFFPLTYSMSSTGSMHQFLQSLDESILVWINDHVRSPFLNSMMLDFSAFGSLAATILITVLSCTFFFIIRDPAAAIHLVLTGAGSVGISFLTKDIFVRARPEIIPQLIKASGFSYPSGHAVSSAAVYVTLAVLCVRHVKTHKQRVGLFAMAATVISVVCFARMYLGVHYPSDTIGGALLGSAWALFMATLFARTHFKKIRA